MLSKQDMITYFEYLDALRESGETNMFGAGPYLVRDCVIDNNEAKIVLSKWRSTFDPDKTIEQRAEEALRP